MENRNAFSYSSISLSHPSGRASKCDLNSFVAYRTQLSKSVWYIGLRISRASPEGKGKKACHVLGVPGRLVALTSENTCFSEIRKHQKLLHGVGHLFLQPRLLARPLSIACFVLHVLTLGNPRLFLFFWRKPLPSPSHLNRFLSPLLSATEGCLFIAINSEPTLQMHQSKARISCQFRGARSPILWSLERNPQASTPRSKKATVYLHRLAPSGHESISR